MSTDAIYAPVRTALRDRVATMPNFATLVPGGISYERDSRGYTPLLDHPYIRETLKPGQSRRASIGPAARIRHNALYLLDVFSAISLGPETSDAITDALMMQFWPGCAVLLPNGASPVKIVSTSPAGAQSVNSGWSMVPVTIVLYFDTITPL